MTYFCCCGGTPPPPPPIGSCCYVVNGVMVCENNISCNDCARKSQYYYCYPGKTCAQVTCPDPPTTTSSTTTTACPCPFSNCGTGCGPFRFCPAGEYFDCVDCECKEGTTLPPFTTTTTSTTTTTTSTTTSTTTTTTACPCPVANCGCPYGPTINCGDGEVFDCDVCECVEGTTTTSTTTTSTTTTTSSTTTTTTTTTTDAPTTTTTSEPEPQKCCCYVNGVYIDCHDLPAGESCDQFSIGLKKCKQYDGVCSGNDCPQVMLTSTTSSTLPPDGPRGCIKCDEPQPCPSPPYKSEAQFINRLCVPPSDGTCPPDYEPTNFSCLTILLQPCQTCEGIGVGCTGGCVYECTTGGGGGGLPMQPMWKLVSDTCQDGNMDRAVCQDCTCPDLPCGPAGGRLTRCDESQIGQTRSAGCCGYCW